MATKATLKSLLQTKVNQLNGSEKIADLLILKRATTGLGLDLTKLKAAINNLDMSSASIDELMLNSAAMNKSGLWPIGLSVVGSMSKGPHGEVLMDEDGSILRRADYPELAAQRMPHEFGWLRELKTFEQPYVNVFKSGTNLVATTGNFGSPAYVSTDNGLKFVASSLPGVRSGFRVYDGVASGDNLLLVGNNNQHKHNAAYVWRYKNGQFQNVYYKHNSRNQIGHTDYPSYISSVGAWGNKVVFAGRDNRAQLIYATSSDGGQTFTERTSLGFDPGKGQRLTMSETVAYACSASEFKRSVDHGISWTNIPSKPFSSGGADVIRSIANRVLALSGREIKISDDKGTSWQNIKHHIPVAETICDIQLTTKRIVIITNRNMYLSSDKFVTKLKVVLPSKQYQANAVAIDESAAFVAAEKDILRADRVSEEFALANIVPLDGETRRKVVVRHPE